MAIASAPSVFSTPIATLEDADRQHISALCVKPTGASPDPRALQPY